MKTKHRSSALVSSAVLTFPERSTRRPGEVHISLQDHNYARKLCRFLQADPSFVGCQIDCGENARKAGPAANRVQVIDMAHLASRSSLAHSPGKTVVIASGAVDLGQIWEGGIVSVLQHSERLELVKLAILAALLRPASLCSAPSPAK